MKGATIILTIATVMSLSILVSPADASPPKSVIGVLNNAERARQQASARSAAAARAAKQRAIAEAHAPADPSGLRRVSFSCYGMRNGAFFSPQNIQLMSGTLYNDGTPISSYTGLPYSGGRLAIHRVQGQAVVRTFYNDYPRRQISFSSIYDFNRGEVFDIEENGSRRKICASRRSVN